MIVGCTRVKQGSMEDAAKTFIQAMIDGDKETLEIINRSDSYNLPTHFLLSQYASDFAEYKISDFRFEADEEKRLVDVIKKDTGNVYLILKIEKQGDKYYFMDWR